MGEYAYAIFTDMQVLKRSTILAPLLLLAMAVLTYLPSLAGDFIWDDHDFILSNKLLHTLSGLGKIWSSAEPVDFWPLSYTLFWLQYQLWGNTPAGYHFVNILLHAGCVIMVWAIMRELDFSRPFAAAAIFALHPIAVESVSWIFQAKTLLAALFSFICIYLFLLQDRKQVTLLKFASVCAFIFAMLSKTSAAFIPIVLTLHSYLRSQNRKSNLLWTIPLWIAAIVIGAVSVWFNIVRSQGGAEIIGAPLLFRIARAFQIIIFYFYKALFPINLSFVYPWPQPVHTHILSGLLVSVFIIALLLLTKKNSVFVPGGALYFLFALLPALGFIEFYYMRFSAVADHYQYIALPGLIVTCVSAITAAPIVKSTKSVRVVVFVGVLSLFTFSNVRAQLRFASEEALWTHTLKQNPASVLAHSKLGEIFFSRNMDKQALYHYRHALQDSSNDMRVLANIGLLYSNLDSLNQAELYLRKALQLAPSAYNHFSLAAVLKNQGDTSSAIKHYMQAASGDDAIPAAAAELGLILHEMGRHDKAVYFLREALGKTDDMRAVLNNLGAALLADGRPTEAREVLQQLVAMDSEHARGWYNLGRAFITENNTDAAFDSFQRALYLQPLYADVRRDYAAELLEQGDTAKARELLLPIWRRAPDFPGVRELWRTIVEKSN